MTTFEDSILWREGELACVMVTCCAGAELQLRRLAPGAGGEQIVLRELYPTKSDLYERARILRSEHKALDPGP